MLEGVVEAIAAGAELIAELFGEWLFSSSTPAEGPRKFEDYASDVGADLTLLGDAASPDMHHHHHHQAHDSNPSVHGGDFHAGDFGGDGGGHH